MNETVLLEERPHNGLAVLTLNRPERMNALNGELMEALLVATRRLAADEDVRAVVLCGAGKGFCAGGDVRDGDGSRRAAEQPRPGFDEQVWSRYSRMQAARYLQEMPKPTIALLHGPVMGAGLSLALACDFRIAATSVNLRSAFAGVALSGDYGIGRALTRTLGVARALEILMLNERLDAAQALNWGLLNRLVADDALRDEGLAFAGRLASGPTLTYAAIKSNIALAANGASLQDYLLHEVRNQTTCHKTDDVREAGRAFMEKRAPQFKGR